MCKTGKNKNWYLPSPGRFTGTSGAGAKRRGACADARLWLAARTGARATPANHSPTRGRGAEALRRLNCDCFFCRKVCLARFSVFLSGGCIMEISRSPFPRPPHARCGGVGDGSRARQNRDIGWWRRSSFSQSFGDSWDFNITELLYPDPWLIELHHLLRTYNLILGEVWGFKAGQIAFSFITKS